MYNNLLCSIHSDREVPVNNEGEGILFAFEGRWQRFPFLQGQGFLLEGVVFEVDWFCKAEKYECQHTVCPCTDENKNSDMFDISTVKWGKHFF